MVAISAPSSSAQVLPFRRWATPAAPATERDAHSAAFAALLERADAEGHLYEAEIDRFLDSLPFYASGRLRAAVLQELVQADVTLLEGAGPAGQIEKLLDGLEYWKKVIALGALTAAFLGHEVLQYVRTPALPWP